MSGNPNILLGVCGSIAAVKSLDLARRLRELPASVRATMTPGAKKMIAPATFEALTEGRVYHDVWDAEAWRMEHLDWAKWADLFVIAPASANTLSDLAAGRADNALTTCALAYRGPLLICPAMNPAMWSHPATQANAKTLRERGALFLGPAGGLALCGDEGAGRMAEVADIVERARQILAERERPASAVEASQGNAPASRLAGLTVMVTAGATREPIDPVRFLSNPSSGKMGFAIAEEAALRGARVELIAGATEVPPPSHPSVRLTRAKTAQQMFEAAMGFAPGAEVCVFAAAVADYTPAHPAAQKIKKEASGGPGLAEIKLKRTPDIAFEVGQLDVPGQLRVGFAAETENILENALSKLRRKGFHLVCANDVSREGSGFASDDNALSIVKNDGSETSFSLRSKRELACRIMDAVEAELASRGREPASAD
jgi:phosphopantothenoylcysteine decarboxylase/phosphopantothenate--cysteine ligase